MARLEQLFALEIEYHRRLHSEAHGTADALALHTSYALQAGYESILRGIGRVSVQDLERLADRLAVTGDSRDILAARDSVARLLGLRAYD